MTPDFALGILTGLMLSTIPLIVSHVIRDRASDREAAREWRAKRDRRLERNRKVNP